MSNEEDTSLLFGVIPSFLLIPEQVARWDHVKESHTFTLLRKPNNLQELNKYKGGVAIWRDNGTLIYVEPSDRSYSHDPYRQYEQAFRQRCLSLHFGTNGPTLCIVGRTDDSIAETAAYFMELEEPTEGSSFFEVVGREAFDFSAVPARCLSRICEATPSRSVYLNNVTLSAEQSVVLATTAHPTTLLGCVFEDGGAAFVKALRNRQSSFGSLTFDTSTGLNDKNLKRLFKVETIDQLTLPLLDHDEIGLRALSAKVNFLDYRIGLSSLSCAGFQPLNIVTKRLALVIHHNLDDFPTQITLWFLRCLADLGHFVELKLRFNFWGNESDTPECVVQALVRAILANSNLNILDLSDSNGSGETLNWGPHLRTILKCLEDHKGIHTFRVDVDDKEEAFGPDYIYLRHLLSRNRNITVTDRNGKAYTDGSLINELYSINPFYCGSADLLVRLPLERPLLVATTLVKSASNEFQRSALLLSDHTDALYELIHSANLSEQNHEDSSSSRAIGRSNRKRTRTMQ